MPHVRTLCSTAQLTIVDFSILKCVVPRFILIISFHHWGSKNVHGDQNWGVYTWLGFRPRNPEGKKTVKIMNRMSRLREKWTLEARFSNESGGKFPVESGGDRRRWVQDLGATEMVQGAFFSCFLCL